MSVLFDYFAAKSDDDAAAAIDLPGGPGGAAPFSPQLQAAIRAGDREAVSRLMLPELRLSEHGILALSTKGVDPYIQMETLEELLTGVDTDVVLGRERAGKEIATIDDGGCAVVALTDELQAALSSATAERLNEVAVPWSQTEEFFGSGEPEVVAHFLGQLAQLARTATESGGRLYCWVCL